MRTRQQPEAAAGRGRAARRIALTATAAALLAACAWLACPRPSLYGGLDFSSAAFDRDGRLLRLSLAADQRYRLLVPLADIAPAAREATLLYEDRHFRRHPGINPVSMLRAAWTSYVTRERLVGASTVTMQLARLRFALQTRRPAGKLMQVLRALQLERHYSKDELLEAYLNLAPYGGNVEGIGAAALAYFDRPAARLTTAQALALAVVPQNPTLRNPATEAGRQALAAARQRLLSQWERRYPVAAATRAACALPLQVRGLRGLPYRAPHFTRRVLAGAGPGRHTTTLDLTLQKLVGGRLRAYVARRGDVGIRNAAALLVDHRSMETVALVGSADFDDPRIAGRVDGVHARRSPGSTLKPLLYALAMDRGLIHPMSLLADAPRRFGGFTPENFDRGFLGPVFARDALVHSRNVPAVELLARVGTDDFHDLLSRAGIGELRDPGHYGLAAVLGGVETTMAEVARLYAMLANRGVLRELRYRRDAPAAEHERRLLSAESAFLVLDMLRSPRSPLPATAPADGEVIANAWKTGTSFGFRDAWTVGVFGPYVLAVWVGNFDGSANPALVGGTAAAPLYFSIFDALAPTLAPAQRPLPGPEGLNLRRVEVCASTGDLPGPHCPRTTTSWFVPGVSPITVSSVHRAVRVSLASGLRSCRGDEPSRLEVYEFWPSDLRRVFRRAGVAIRRPPPWEPDCAAPATDGEGTAPRITSPQPGLVYRLPDSGPAQLVFTAVSDGDARRLYWFVGSRFVGEGATGAAVFWAPPAGEHTVTVIDDHGRAASTRVAVARRPGTAHESLP